MVHIVEKLNMDPNATEQDVLQHLHERRQYGIEMQQPTLTVEEFWQSGDLEAFHALKNWWPTDAPQLIGIPYLGSYCNMIMGNQMIEPIPFRAYMEKQWQRCVAWLTENNRNVDNPNETKEERRRRLGREAVARHRKVATVVDADTRGAEVKRLHGEYIEACRQRKTAYEGWNDTVNAAKAAWETAKQELLDNANTR